jgi:beta-alanine--pyruvate transaminase
MNTSHEMDHYWMPFTANRDFKDSPRIVARAEGMYYFDGEDRRILDGSSGLFTCAAGHCRREIVDAIAQQAGTLDYNPSFNLAHPLSFAYANAVAALLPAELDRVFFANSGSEAVDTAMKIALAYHRSRGESSRTLFVSRERAYHGVNIGGTALSGMINNRRHYGTLMPGVLHMRHTLLEQNRFSRGLPAHGAELADDLQRLLELHGAENIAACFVEPIAGSWGTILPPQGYLERLRAICDRHGILLVFDEVITGFGRTGKAFAAQSFGVTPDLITMAKAMTNGAVPMGGIAVRRAIHDTVVNAAPERAVELFHGYTYSAHPLACAAGLATLGLYERDGLFARGEQLSPYFQDAMHALGKEFDVIVDVRGYGMMAGVELAMDGAPGKRGNDFYQKLFHQGLHIKTTGDNAIIAPALIAEREHIDALCELLRGQLRCY